MRAPSWTPWAAGVALICLVLGYAQAAWSRDVVIDREAASCAGRVCRIEGRVAKVVTAKDHTTVLSLGNDSRKPTFIALIPANSSAQFGQVQAFKGQRVLVTGLIKMHLGHPETTLDYPTQLVSTAE
jgi:hypothetical protein